MDLNAEIQAFNKHCITTAEEMAKAKPADANPKQYFFKTFLTYNGQILPLSEKILEEYSKMADKSEYTSLARSLQESTEKGLEHYKDLLGVELDFELNSNE